MFRLHLMSGKWYATKIDDLSNEEEVLHEFLDQGEFVVLTYEVKLFAEEMGIDFKSIEMV